MSSAHEPSANSPSDARPSERAPLLNAPAPDALLPEPQAQWCARFRERYEQTARFREDRALADLLTEQAAPLLAALASIGPPPHAPGTLHDVYALLGALSRRAAELGATPSISITLIDAIVHALCAQQLELEPAVQQELRMVAVEAYSAARDERSTAALRKRAADSQVWLPLAPRCCSILLAGSHEEPDLSPVLERFACDLLRDDIKSCLLDLSRLGPVDEELARSLGRFCSQALTLGVQLALVGAGPELQQAFLGWSLEGAGLRFFETYDRAQAATFASAGLELRMLRRWARLFLPASSGLVR